MKRILLSCMFAVTALYMAAESVASYPGGQEALDSYLSTNVRYPEFARDNGIEGTVTVDFTVNADGTITGVKIVRPLDPELEAEAKRLVMAMPSWTPATDAAGKPVVSTVSLPVKFRLK